MNSSLRPALKDAQPGTPCMTNGTADLMILQAVAGEKGLIHGRLHTADGASCAIGSYFNINGRTCLPEALIQEVAAVNDSLPHATRRQRKRYVMRWLRWKLIQFKMPGF